MLALGAQLADQVPRWTARLRNRDPSSARRGEEVAFGIADESAGHGEALFSGRRTIADPGGFAFSSRPNATEWFVGVRHAG